MGRLAGILLTAAGILLLGAWVPGADGMATGPRIGIGMALLTVGGLMLAIPLGTWLIRRTTRPADYATRCPVGESCSGCGAFNLKPRQACRSCGGPVNNEHAVVPQRA